MILIFYCLTILCRVVPGKSYLKHFYSDRMHMYSEGKWNSPPPSYMPIMNGLAYAASHGNKDGNACKGSKYKKGRSNLEMYINMSEKSYLNDQSAGKNEMISEVDIKQVSVVTNVGKSREEFNIGKPLSLAQFRAVFTAGEYNNVS